MRMDTCLIAEPLGFVLGINLLGLTNPCVPLLRDQCGSYTVASPKYRDKELCSTVCAKGLWPDGQSNQIESWKGTYEGNLGNTHH